MRVPDRTRVLAFGLACVSIGGCGPTAPDLPLKTIGIPSGWLGSTGASDLYVIGLDRAYRHGGRWAAYMTGTELFTPEVASLQQLVRADNYLGKRVRLSAWVKGWDLIGPIAGLWMRVDGPGVVTGYDNMNTRAETGTPDWHEISIVLDVPSNALGIVIGAMRQGGGTLVIDDIRLEPVGSDVPSTNVLAAPLVNTIDSATTVANYLGAAASPTNADFERWP